MSGASAGGLNAVMMAEAIRRKMDFSNFLDLWQECADIGRLVKSPSRAAKFDERALLDGVYFEEMLYNALTQGPEPPLELDQDLAVFASATLVNSAEVVFTDVPGAPITETRSDAYFHVARRGLHEHGVLSRAALLHWLHENGAQDGDLAALIERSEALHDLSDEVDALAELQAVALRLQEQQVIDELNLLAESGDMSSSQRERYEELHRVRVGLAARSVARPESSA